MGVFVDPRTGTVYSNVPEDEEERARSEYGLVPQAEFQKTKTDDAADTKGAFGLIGEGFERGLGEIQDVARSAGWTPPVPGSEAFGVGGGGLPAFDAPQAPAPAPGAETFPEAFSPEARIRSQRHPVLTGIGTGLAVAPASAIAGAAGAALAPAAVPLVGGTVGGILGEQAVEAVAQEYDDAWLEERPFELKRAAGYLGMFGIGDLLFRGGGKVIGKGLGALAAPTSVQKSALATGRNVVAEAQAQATKAGARPATRSVGAASAQEMNDPFDDAIGQMSEADAYVLSRDFDDHSFLVARDIADEMTRINKGLSEDLGNDLKYRDFEIAADAWDGSALERQADFYQELDGRGRDLVEAIELSPVDLGNHGKRVAADITQKLDDIAAADTPARKLYLLDQFKRTLDKRTMAIAGDFQSDQVGRTDLLGLLDDFSGGADTRGWLRESIEDANLFGHAADLQKSLNAPWHEMLKSWRKVSDAFLEATGEKQFGVMGAGRNVMEGTVDKARAVIGKDPRALAEFRQHLGHVFDGYQGLIDARNAHGIVEKGNLPVLEQSIRNLMEDWNLGATLGVAKAKAAHIQRNPRHWRRILEAAEGVGGIGGFIKGARQLSQLTGDLHIQKGTTLANVWDEALRRYAKHPSLAESPTYASYSPWMQDALRTRGARIPGPPEGTGGVGQAVAGAAGNAVREHGSKVAGAGLLAGSAALSDEQPEGAAGAGVGGLALLLGKGGARLFKEEANQILGGKVGRVLADAADKEAWGHVISRRWLKSKEPLSVRTIEWENTEAVLGANGFWQRPDDVTPMPELRAYVEDAMGRTGATEDQIIRALVAEGSGFKPKGPRVPGSAPRKPKAATPPAPPVEDRSGIEGEFDDLGEELLQPPDMKESLKEARRAIGKEGQAAFKAYQSHQGYVMNEALRTGDYSRRAAERAGDVQAYLQAAIDSGATAPGFVRRGIELSREEVERLTQAKILTAQGFVSTSPKPALAKRFAGATGEEKRIKGLGERRTAGQIPVLFEIEQATGVPLNAVEVTLRPGTQFKVLGHRVEKAKSGEGGILHVFRVRESGYRPGGKTEGIIAGGLIGLGGLAAASNASAAEPPDARSFDRPTGPSPETGPATLYREAVRGIDEGGANVIRQKASAALRRTPPRGRSPLRAFTGGRRDLDAAVDAARETLAELEGDPSALIETLASNMGDLPRTHPSVYMALTEKAVGIVSYLSAAVPERTAQTLLDPVGIAPSADRSLEFAYKVVGATNPRQAMGDISRLDIPPEELEAFQGNWPELWEPFKAELIGQAMRRAEGGRPVDAEKLRRLDEILGMNGQLDPSGSAEVAMHMLAAQEQAPAAPASNSPPTQAPSASGRSASLFATRAAGAQMENQIG
jgi:hypothetical protein